MLDVNNAKYIGSYVDYKKLDPHEGSDIVLLGRSNVGKSSFINCLTNRKKLAYISQTPGKTRTLNQYYINDQLTLVDVPGYGYAKVSFTMRNQFLDMIDTFLRTDEKIKLVIQLIDFKVGPTRDDLAMLEYIQQLGLDYIIVCTKLDKIAKTKLKKQKQKILSMLNVNQDLVYFYSNHQPQTINTISQYIENKISND